MKDVLVLSWDAGAQTRTSPCYSNGSLWPLYLHVLLFFQKIQLIWESLKHLQVEVSQLTSFPHLVNFFLPLPHQIHCRAKEISCSLEIHRVVFYDLALTESLCSLKPPEGTRCYCMGDLYYSGSKTPQLRISAFSEEMQLCSDRKEFSSTEGQSSIFCAQGKFLLSDQHDRFYLGLGAAQTCGMGWGAVFHAVCL